MTDEQRRRVLALIVAEGDVPTAEQFEDAEAVAELEEMPPIPLEPELAARLTRAALRHLDESSRR